MYTELPDEKALNKLKDFMKKHIDETYAGLLDVDYEAIKLESEPEPCRA